MRRTACLAVTLVSICMLAPSAAAQVIQSFRDCPECPEMVEVPAGSFTMGAPEGEEGRNDDEGPVRTVTIAKKFAVGKYEVTYAEWDACYAAGACNKYRPEDHGQGRGRRPVIDVSFQDAGQYAYWLSTKTGKSYRLLSEAEWEYAARAGTTTAFSTGKTITTDQANFDGTYTYGGSSVGTKRGKAIEVGSFTANAFGLHDMHGNVNEWVADCYTDSYAGAPVDGSASNTGDCEARHIRGGDAGSRPRDLRSAYRSYGSNSDRMSNTGFRVAMTLP